jgi:hypothetical protein
VRAIDVCKYMTCSVVSVYIHTCAKHSSAPAASTLRYTVAHGDATADSRPSCNPSCNANTRTSGSAVILSKQPVASVFNEL